jgi:chorismate lyase / 3-hydroxybenzoate synthase
MSSDDRLRAPWRCELLAPASESAPTPAAGDSTLLTVAYGERDAPRAEPESPRLQVPNRVLAGDAQVEHWHSAAPVRRGQRGELVWAEDGEMLAGCLRRPLGDDLEAVSEELFGGLIDLAVELGYSHLLRIWNYLPAINHGALEDERYRQFNRGRLRAFEARDDSPRAPLRFPASSAVGTAGRDLRTAFLASAAAPLPIENPRQVPAFRYPPAYGTASPSFCRATLAPSALGDAFFLSGTASVVGHRTLHAESVVLQVEETLRNIAALLTRARCRSGREIPELAEFDLVKVYLRRAGDLEAVRAALAATLSSSTPTIYLEADICRHDLLVEIDGFALGRGR